MLHVLNVEDVKDAYSSSVVYLIQKEEKDDDWVEHVPDPQHRQKKPFLVVRLFFIN